MVSNLKMIFVMIVVAIFSCMGLVSCQDLPVDPDLGNIYMSLIDAMVSVGKSCLFCLFDFLKGLHFAIP